MKNENTFGKKKYVKIREKTETIKNISVSRLQKVFQNCDDNFFQKYIKFGLIFKLIFCCQYMETVGHDIKQKTSNKYCCEICDYVTDRKSNFDNHLLTAKHQMATNGNSWQQDSSNNFCCENCNKK